jgi:cell division protein FtsI (penicillin-binding protein 3)
MMLTKMTNLLTFLLPFGVAFSNDFLWNHTDSPNQTLAQIWTGVIVLYGLLYTSGTLPHAALKPANLFRQSETLQLQHPWVIWMLVSVWSLGWLVALRTLPSGNFLKLVVLPIFFGLIWYSLKFGGAGNSMPRKIMVATLGAYAGSLALLLTTSPFRLARLLSDWMGALDLAGRHYEHAQVLKAWSVLQFWGPSRQPLTNMHLTADRLELLRFMAEFGVGPGALMGTSLILGWWAVWCWLRRTVPGPAFTIEIRRIGLALIVMHGVAAVVYVLFNMGLTRQPFGGELLPYSGQQAWWMLSAALAWVVVRAIRNRKVLQTVPNGRRWWISLMGYGMAGSALAMALVLLNDIQRSGSHIQPSSQTSYITRKVIRDASGKVIAENVLAYDLWIKPSEFWAASLLNPKQTGLTEDGGQEHQHTDAERERILMDALAQWPQTQSLVKHRLANWPKSKSSLAILAWAITPEIADKISAIQMPGLLTKPRTSRHYPDGSLYAHALGYASLPDMHHGQDGLELVANLQLVTASPSPGASDQKGINTTLVPEIQKAARDTLRAGVKEHSAIGGAVVVIDLDKNAIAAMVSAPDFDPNDSSSYRNPYQPERIRNRATSLSFPLGELISPLIVAHGVQVGRITALTRVTLGDGTLHIGDAVIRDSSRYGTVTAEEIIAKSSNVGLAKLSLQMPLSELQGITETLGIGRPLEIAGLPGGFSEDTSAWSQWTSQMQAMPGNSIETNLMQVLKAYTPIATSGYIGIPTMLASRNQNRSAQRGLSHETSQALRHALQLATSKYGIAPMAKVPGTTVAGKTATMTDGFWTDDRTGKLIPRSDTSAFIGMLPENQPKWLVGVLLEFDHGKAKFAGRSVAPMFAALAQKALIEPIVSGPVIAAASDPVR